MGNKILYFVDLCDIFSCISRVTTGKRQTQMQVQRVEKLSTLFEIGKRIGSGTYARVYTAKDKESGETYALKQYKENHDKGFGLTENLLREAMLLKRLAHPNIIEFSKLVKCRAKYILVLEYFSMSLELRLEKQHQPLLLPQIIQIARDVTSALEYCHLKSVIHRDVSVSNIFLREDMHAKLADFNLSREYDEETLQQHPLTPGMVTLNYRAPELLVGKAYGEKVDIWALGCVLVEMFTREVLFDGESELETLTEIMQTLEHVEPPPWIRNKLKKRKRPFPKKKMPNLDARVKGILKKKVTGTPMPEDVYVLAKSILLYEPTQRPCAREILEKLI